MQGLHRIVAPWLSYAAAFERPVRSAAGGGNGAPSVDALAAYAEAAGAFLGTTHRIWSGWSSPELKDLPEALGSRADGLDALIADGVSRLAGTQAGDGAA